MLYEEKHDMWLNRWLVKPLALCSLGSPRKRIPQVGRRTGDGDTGDHRLVTRDLELACQ